MVAALSLYISAAPEMDIECELVGQVLAQMSRTIQWTIKRTPAPHQGGNPDWEALQHSTLYLILLGMDLMAPMGVEYERIQRRGIHCFAYVNRAMVASPAASYFGRHSGLRWKSYTTAQEFIRDMESALIAELIQGTPGYGLGLAEIEDLGRRLRTLRDEETPEAGEEDRRGAGRGGIILPTVSN